MRRAETVSVTQEERDALEAIARGRRSEVRHATRAKMVLLAVDGLENAEIAKRLGVSRVTVATWRGRFNQGRLAGTAKDLPRGGRRPPVMQRESSRIVEATLHGGTRPPPAHRLASPRPLPNDPRDAARHAVGGAEVATEATISKCERGTMKWVVHDRPQVSLPIGIFPGSQRNL